MRKPVVITTPFPTLEETARILGVSRERRKWLEALVDEIQGSSPAGRPHPSLRVDVRKSKKKTMAGWAAGDLRASRAVARKKKAAGGRGIATKKR